MEFLMNTEYKISWTANTSTSTVRKMSKIGTISTVKTSKTKEGPSSFVYVNKLWYLFLRYCVGNISEECFFLQDAFKD